jgi:predicted amidophosphoribosyltransferase
VLEAVANRFKFDNQRGWALILGRLLVGHMDSEAAAFRDYDLIIPTPAWTGRGASRNWDHALEVVKAANDAAGGRWPFRIDPVIVRTGSVTPMKRKKAAERRRIAEEELRPKLRVVDASAVNDRRVLVYDDIFTDGSTLREVGLALMAEGATRVGGVSLMRQLLAPAALAKSRAR